MTVENISWSISMKECCWPRWGSNLWPPGLQSDIHSTAPPRPARWDVFLLGILFFLNYFVLMTISYQKPFVFSVSVFCSQIFTLKLNLRSKIGLTYVIYIVNDFLSKKIFLTFLYCWVWIIDVSQQYCENFRKAEQAELVENLPPSYLPYRFLHNLRSFSLWEKVKVFEFFWKPMTRIKDFYVHR